MDATADSQLEAAALGLPAGGAQKKRSHIWLWLLGGALVLAVVLGAVAWSRRKKTAPPPPTKCSTVPACVNGNLRQQQGNPCPACICDTGFTGAACDQPSGNGPPAVDTDYQWTVDAVNQQIIQGPSASGTQCLMVDASPSNGGRYEPLVTGTCSRNTNNGVGLVLVPQTNNQVQIQPTHNTQPLSNLCAVSYRQSGILNDCYQSGSNASDYCRDQAACYCNLQMDSCTESNTPQNPLWIHYPDTGVLQHVPTNKCLRTYPLSSGFNGGNQIGLDVCPQGTPLP